LRRYIKSYFTEVTDAVLQEHHVTLFQLLDEMLDSGIPVNTHPGGLKVGYAAPAPPIMGTLTPCDGPLAPLYRALMGTCPPEHGHLNPL